MVRLGCAVAAGAADLLVVRFQAARQRGMNHGAHVRLVDPHAEGDGGDHHLDAALEEFLLDALAVLGIEPGVVGGAGKVAGQVRRPREVACARVGVYTIAGRRSSSSSSSSVRSARCEGATSTTSIARLSRRKPWMNRAGCIERQLHGDIVLHDRAWRWRSGR